MRALCIRLQAVHMEQARANHQRTGALTPSHPRALLLHVGTVLRIGSAQELRAQAALLRFGLSSATWPVDLLEKKYSREHESEADEVGLLLASRACFDPHHAQYLFAEFERLKLVTRIESLCP